MGRTRREVLGGSTAALLASALAGCGGGSGQAQSGQKQSGQKQSGLGPGIAARQVPCGVDAVDMASFQSITGTTAQYLRVYHPPSLPLPVSIDGKPEVRSYLALGRDVVISFTPTHGGPDAANLQRFGQWCRSVTRAGYTRQIQATVYHEPVHKVQHAAEFKRQYTAFQQVAAQHQISFGVIQNTFPFTHGKDVLADWMPAPATWDWLGIDVYAGDDPRGTWHNPLSTIAPMTSYATGQGRPFSICEVGVDQKLYTTPATAADARAWLTSFSELGESCRWLCYFDYGAWSIKLNAGALVPAYQQLHTALTTR
jgi:hypothetical protein